MKAKLVVEATEKGVSAVRLGKKDRGAKPARSGAKGSERKRWDEIARKELEAYFAGRLKRFAARCDLERLTPFTRAVLKITARIPYGEVRSYQWVARKLRKPDASRAVGNALARNPIPIIVPCHRVVRSDGAIGGFALGPGWKKRLLALEKQR